MLILKFRHQGNTRCCSSFPNISQIQVLNMLPFNAATIALQYKSKLLCWNLVCENLPKDV